MTDGTLPVIASAEMGYGHLRAAQALASVLEAEILHVDRPPLVSPEELRLWSASRRLYDGAPPVIPHAPLNIKCVACHTDTGKEAPPPTRD